MSGRYRPRSTRSTGVSIIGGWSLKRYEITLNGDAIDPAILLAADRVLDANLPDVAPGTPGVGFVVVHHGEQSVWMLADFWDVDILSQRTFSAPLEDPTRFTGVPPGGPTACVWELPVHSHERDAFVTHIIDPADGPDVAAYLADAMPDPLALTSQMTGSEAAPYPRSPRATVTAFNEAWDRGDVDGLMALMSDTPTYRASTGATPGTDHHGTEAVRSGFAEVIAAEQAGGSVTDAQTVTGEILTFGDRALSFWSYPIAGPDGAATEVEGVDVWTFTPDGRIAVKDAYRRSFPDPEFGPSVRNA